MLPIRARISLLNHQPLYRRVPTRDAQGNLLTDFMMLLPGLRERPEAQLRERLARIQAVMEQFREVVFVDLNLRLNLLWVSVRPRPGIILNISCALKCDLPEALLIAQRTVY